jgi:hypothetical protein
MEGEEYDDDMQHEEDLEGIGVAVEHDGSTTGGGHSSPLNGVRDSGVAMDGSSPTTSRGSKGTPASNLSPVAAVKAGRRNQHQRQRSLYDGSDYGGDSDLEEHGGISAGLERQMAAIEGLVRRGLEENGSATDGVVQRVVERLRDLGSQTGIESGATRCVHTFSPNSVPFWLPRTRGETHEDY